MALGAVPRLKSKLAVLVFRSQAEVLLRDAAVALDVIMEGCSQVRDR